MRTRGAAALQYFSYTVTENFKEESFNVTKSLLYMKILQKHHIVTFFRKLLIRQKPPHCRNYPPLDPLGSKNADII